MSKAITVWLDDEAEQALAHIESTGVGEAEAVRTAIIEAAAHTKLHRSVHDSAALEQALDRSHDLVAEILTTHRPPR
jgi:hypothetical protein